MAKQRKTASQAADKFATRVGQTTGDYIAGVSAPGIDWVGQATSASATARRDQALMQAIQAGTINEGIQKAGNQKWAQNAKVKGGANWGPQTVAAKSRYMAAQQVVEGDYSTADAAMAQAGDGSTHQSRMARMVAWDNTLHNAARARKGLPGE